MSNWFLIVAVKEAKVKCWAKGERCDFQSQEEKKGTRGLRQSRWWGRGSSRHGGLGHLQSVASTVGRGQGGWGRVFFAQPLSYLASFKILRLSGVFHPPGLKWAGETAQPRWWAAAWWS